MYSFYQRSEGCWRCDCYYFRWFGIFREKTSFTRLEILVADWGADKKFKEKLIDLYRALQVQGESALKDGGMQAIFYGVSKTKNKGIKNVGFIVRLGRLHAEEMFEMQESPKAYGMDKFVH